MSVITIKFKNFKKQFLNLIAKQQNSCKRKETIKPCFNKKSAGKSIWSLFFLSLYQKDGKPFLFANYKMVIKKPKCTHSINTLIVFPFFKMVAFFSNWEKNVWASKMTKRAFLNYHFLTHKTKARKSFLDPLKKLKGLTNTVLFKWYT